MGPLTWKGTLQLGPGPGAQRERDCGLHTGKVAQVSRAGAKAQNGPCAVQGPAWWAQEGGFYLFVCCCLVLFCFVCLWVAVKVA